MVAAATSRDYPQWEYDFLSSIGAPQNKAQLDALNLWAGSEGMPANTNNFLAITDPNGEFGTPGGQPPGALAPGVWNYVKGTRTPLVVTFPSRSAGINALVSFLQHGHQGIIAALRDDKATVESIRSAVAADGAWGGDAFAKGARTSTAQTGIFQGGAPSGANATKAKLGGSSFYQCQSNQAVIGEGGIVFGIGKLTLVNSCQAKALCGGLVVGVGGLLMVTGLVLLGVAAVEKLGVNSLVQKVASPLTNLQNQILNTNSTVSKETKVQPAKNTRKNENANVAAIRREQGNAAADEILRRQEATFAKVRAQKLAQQKAS